MVFALKVSNIIRIWVYKIILYFNTVTNHKTFFSGKMTLRDKNGDEVTEPDVLGYVEVDMGMGEKGFLCKSIDKYSESRGFPKRENYNIQLKICRDLGFEGV